MGMRARARLARPPPRARSPGRCRRAACPCRRWRPRSRRRPPPPRRPGGWSRPPRPARPRSPSPDRPRRAGRSPPPWPEPAAPPTRSRRGCKLRSRDAHWEPVMRLRTVGILGPLLIAAGPALASDIAPTGTLRAVFLASNPAQAVRDPASGEFRGASADLARELGRRIGVPVSLTPSANPQTVIEAVSTGEAAIGFVAYAPSRTGTVAFSQTYMLVRQSFLVP